MVVHAIPPSVASVTMVNHPRTSSSSSSSGSSSSSVLFFASNVIRLRDIPSGTLQQDLLQFRSDSVANHYSVASPYDYQFQFTDEAGQSVAQVWNEPRKEARGGEEDTSTG